MRTLLLRASLFLLFVGIVPFSHADSRLWEASRLLSDVPVGASLKFRRPIRYPRGASLISGHHQASAHLCMVAVSYFNHLTRTMIDEEARREVAEGRRRIVLGEGELEEFTVTDTYVTGTVHVNLENSRGVSMEIWCSEGVTVGQFAAMYSNRPYFLVEER